MKKNARLIAFYLPQYHPIPENDEWWGKGFTEWTNVAKAKPLYRGHYQPRIPADLGFYDLRVPEAREAQADLAKKYGIEGFCYWHYWFGDGRRLLERPFNEVLKTGRPDFPFCLGWANDSWTGVWYGAPDRVLIEQKYPGAYDHEAHFYALLDAFRDKRYITVHDKKLFLINSPVRLPNIKAFIEQWRLLAAKEGLEGFHFVGSEIKNPEEYYCDAAVGDSPYVFLKAPFLEKVRTFVEVAMQRFFSIDLNVYIKRRYPMIRSYESLVNYLDKVTLSTNEYPLVIPNWDNSPRSNTNGMSLHGATPELFKQMLLSALRKLDPISDAEKRIIFVKSWNEWAEGNYLEPDIEFGHSYLEVVKECIRLTA